MGDAELDPPQKPWWRRWRVLGGIAGGLILGMGLLAGIQAWRSYRPDTPERRLVDQLIADLVGADPAARSAAIGLLADPPESQAEHVRRVIEETALQAPDPAVRVAALRAAKGVFAFGTPGSGTNTSAPARPIDDPDRMRGVALGVKAMEDPQVEVRTEALGLFTGCLAPSHYTRAPAYNQRMIGLVKPRDPVGHVVVQALCRVIANDSHPLNRTLALLGIREWHEMDEAPPEVIAAIEDPDSEVAETAFMVMQRGWRESTRRAYGDRLRRFVREDRPSWLRAMAIAELRKDLVQDAEARRSKGLPAPSAPPELVALLDDPDASLRYEAFLSLSPPDGSGQAEPVLDDAGRISLLERVMPQIGTEPPDDQAARSTLAGYLWRNMGPAVEEPVRAGVPARPRIEDWGGQNVRIALINLTRGLGPRARAAAPVLRRCAHDALERPAYPNAIDYRPIDVLMEITPEDPEVQELFVRTLRRIAAALGTRSFVPTAFVGERFWTPFDRLAAYGPGARCALPVAEEMAKSDDPLVRLWGERALVQLGERKDVDPATNEAAGKSEQMRLGQAAGAEER